MNIRINTGHNSGFTLLELLIVVAVIGILAAIGIPQYHGYQNQAKTNAVKTQFSTIANLMSSELTKCNAGADSILENSSQSVLCNGTNADLQAAFVAYGNSSGRNVYDESEAAYIDTGTPDTGQILIEATPGNTGNFTITGTYTDSGSPATVGPKIINRE